MPNRRTQGDATAATRVLVIEDEETSRRAIAQGLLEAGFNVVEAVDGVAGLELGPGQRREIGRGARGRQGGRRGAV